MVAGLKSFPTARTDLIVSIGAVHIRLPVRVLVVGQTLPMDSAPVPPDVRCCSKSDHLRRECEMTLSNRTHALQLKASYSITSSAATSSVAGTVRPSAFAALRLMTNSNFVGS